jgi:hypothetical protein
MKFRSLYFFEIPFFDSRILCQLISLLCTHCLPANRAFQNQKSGWSTRSFFCLAKEARHMAKFAQCSFAKTTANCSNSFCHFHLISSMSRPQYISWNCMKFRSIYFFERVGILLHFFGKKLCFWIDVIANYWIDVIASSIVWISLFL